LNKNTETEVKLYTPDHTAIVAKLQSLGAKVLYPRILERNFRFENAKETFVQSGIVLRLREDSRVRLTYKDGRSVTNGIVTRREFEVEVSDMETMRDILQGLGYHIYMSYEKYRTTYEFYGAEVVLDELPYGNFTEIEGDIDTIEDIIRALGLQDAPRHPDSYVALFGRVKERVGMMATDLTFENFEGILLPPDTFTATTP